MVKIKQENETKRERFIRLAETRTQKVLNALRILGNCSNLQNYEFSKDEVINIFSEIEKTTKRIKEVINNFIEKLEELKTEQIIKEIIDLTYKEGDKDTVQRLKTDSIKREKILNLISELQND